MKYYTGTITSTFTKFSALFPAILTDNLSSISLAEIQDTVNSFEISTTNSDVGLFYPSLQRAKIFDCDGLSDLYIKSSVASSTIRLMLHQVSL